ncbi:ABC transporter ATP-binding protein [Pseudomonas gingeri]|uniref:ABC transporter ATP-binding protein n=1 Tax=Pseudomonas gingeri TaxID=117681 RepID=A0A7Y7YFT3_9PSED|nr:ABC transporter ATP-binding protein [Pseudomonas gingeri]NWB31439.1 ABC transporter ATP-binding protein [Pseudomonas gingeri]NWC35696.1 ABC transporter ATP-binding protein [Pseudomonas gingeri]NWD49453.1 ABC transporter ATP-binding protein [Pseudomonas gingeri]
MQVSFEKIEQSYGGHTLFKQLDLIIPSGQFFTLLGPSGCGKTTLLRMLAGFVHPDSGCVRFGVEDVTAIPVHRRGVGIVFQDYALFPDRSVLANVAYGLLARNVPKAQAADRASAILRRVGLEAFKDRTPAALSGGQRQRVAMARALVIEPKLLLLDEPLSALDVKLRGELRAMIRELQQEAGITTVFVTHDQEEALAMSDQIAVMDRGQLVQIGTPQQIYAKPRTAFAADFVGNANLIPILEELPADNCGARRLKTAVGTLFTNSDAPWQPGALLAVRGAEIRLHAAGAGQGKDVCGVIEHVEYRGSTVGYTVQTAAGALHVDAWASPRIPLHVRGDAVALEIPRTAHIVEGWAC